MRLLIYDIQDPVDPQVNGFGLYRSVVDGTEELILVFTIAGQTTFTLSAAEVSDGIGNPQPCT